MINNNFKIATAILLLTVVIGGCNKNEVEDPAIVAEPIEMITNGDVESGNSNSVVPDGWMYLDGSGSYNVNWASDVYLSSARSLHISASEAVQQEFAAWGYQKCGTMPVGKKVTLKVNIKGNITGPPSTSGTTIGLRVDGSSGVILQHMTSVRITGEFDWNEHSIEISRIDPGAKCIYIWLVFKPETTGDVYFDDASLTYQ